MKIADYEIKQRDKCGGKNRYCLFKNGYLVSQTSFGTYEKAVKEFTKYIKNNCLDVTIPDSVKEANFLNIRTNDRTVGNYSNSGYLKLMENN